MEKECKREGAQGNFLMKNYHSSRRSGEQNMEQTSIARLNATRHLSRCYSFTSISKV